MHSILQIILNVIIQLFTLLFVLSIVGLAWFILACIGWIVEKDGRGKDERH
jgi:hypothetical protein